VGVTTGTIINANLITQNVGPGVYLQDSDGTTLTSNKIGTTREGLEARPNDGAGIQILDCMGTVIGGGSSFADRGNLISGNATQGVVLSGARTVSTLIVGNYIGANITGTLPLGNEEEGVAIGGDPAIGAASKTTVRNNVILGNGKQGVLISRGA